MKQMLLKDNSFFHTTPKQKYAIILPFIQISQPSEAVPPLASSGLGLHFRGLSLGNLPQPLPLLFQRLLFPPLLFDSFGLAESLAHLAGKHSPQVGLDDDGGPTLVEELDPGAPRQVPGLDHPGGAHHCHILPALDITWRSYTRSIQY